MNQNYIPTNKEKATLAGVAEDKSQNTPKVAYVHANATTSQQAFMEEDLRKSGITPNTAAKLGIHPIDAQQCREILGFQAHDQNGNPIDGYAIPFADPMTGQPMTCPDNRPYIRVKLRTQAVMPDGSTAKYLSPRKAGQHAYIQAAVHQAIMAGADVILTEGEKKAICATWRDLAVIGLVGIWGGRDKAAGEGASNDRLLPELFRYARAGATWTLIFDSDAANPTKVKDFMFAAARLAKVLIVYQVSLKLVILPSIKPIGKTGLDDFALHHGDQFLPEIKALIDSASMVSPDLRSLTSAVNGGKGGRKPAVKEIADACADSFRDSEGVLQLRYYRSTWFRYKSGSYQATSTSDIDALVMGWLRKHYPDHATPNMLKSVQMNLKASDLCGVNSDVTLPALLDGRPTGRLLVMKNAVVDLEQLIDASTGKLTDHGKMFHRLSPRLFSTLALPYSYDPSSTANLWKQFLDGALPDSEDRKMLQMMFGLALTANTTFNVFFLLYGQAGTGKNVVVEVLRALVGKENCSAVQLDMLGERFMLHPLTEKLLNIVGDLPERIPPAVMDRIEGQLKDVTSGAVMQVERKGIDAETRRIIARCIFASNHFPPFRDTSEGLWDRLRIIPFHQRFRNTPKQILDFHQQIITTELPGVLNWALEGLIMLRDLRCFPESPSGLQLKQQQHRRSDSIGTFLQDCVITTPTGQVSTTALMAAYESYCSEHWLPVASMGQLADRISIANPSTKKIRKHQPGGGQLTCWQGIELKS